MDDNKNNKKTNWIPTIISIVIGVLVAIFTTWYTVYSGKKEAVEAETERLDNVKGNLVAIIEEHIVNKDSIDLQCLNRLIYNRTKEEGLYKSPTIYNLLTQAEYNIQNSKHLSFDKKKEYTKILSSLYLEFVTDTVLEFSNNRFPEHTAEIIKCFGETSKIDGEKSLISLVEKYEQEIVELNNNNISKSESSFDYLFKSPTTLISVLLAYMLATFLVYYLLRIRRRKREMLFEMKEKVSYRREKLREETERLIKFLESNDLSKEEKQGIERRIEDLYDQLENLENYYRQQWV